MALSRTDAVDQQFRQVVSTCQEGASRGSLDLPVREQTGLSARDAIALFETQVTSRK